MGRRPTLVRQKPWPALLARLERDNPLRQLPHLQSYARFERDLPRIAKAAFTFDIPNGFSVRCQSCELGDPSTSEEAARGGSDSLLRPLHIVLLVSSPETPRGSRIDLFIELPVPTSRGTLIRGSTTTTSEWAPLAQLVRRPGLHLSEERVKSTDTMRRVARVHPLVGAPLIVSARSRRGRSLVTVSAPGGEPNDRVIAAEVFLVRLRAGVEAQRPVWCRHPAWVLGEFGRVDLTSRLQGTDGPPTHLVPDDLDAVVRLIASAWPGADDGRHLERQQVLLLGDHLERAIYRGAHRVLDALSRKRVDLAALPWIFARAIDRTLAPLWGTSRTPLAERLEDLNPLSLLSATRKVTMCGPGGVSPEALVRDRRDVHYSHLGRLCPIETPESDHLGLTLFLATHSAIDENGRPVTPVFAPGAKTSRLTPAGAEDVVKVSATRDVPAPVAWRPETHRAHVVASRPLDILHARRPLARLPSMAAEEGERLVRDAGAKGAHLVWPGQTLGVSASLIPFVAHDDGARAMMGAKNMKQAMPLTKPEVPVVQTGFERLVPDAVGQVVRASAPGTVARVRSGDRVEMTIIEKGRTERTYQTPIRRPGQSGGDIEFVARVELLDSVRKGQVLAEGPGTVDGVLALGRNLLVAYMPWYGFNFEDGIVVSDAAAKALTARHSQRIVVPIWPGPRLRRKGPAPTDLGISLDADGVIRVGAEVAVGTTLIRFGEQSVVAWQGVRGKVRSVNRQGFAAGGTPATHYPLEVVTIDLVDEAPLAVGDKLMGRHGNKGVVTLILPQHDMPRLEDGTPLDVLLNPHSVVGRMNLGQLFETHLGLLAWTARRSHMEQHYIVPPFVGVDETWLFGELKKAGFPEGKARVVHAATNVALQAPVTVGLQYMLRLNHNAADKIAWRMSGPRNRVTGQATRGRSALGGQRFGEMEGWALLAHGTPHLLREMTTKADGATAAIGAPDSSVTFDMLVSHLRGLGLEVVVCFGRTTLKVGDRRTLRRLALGHDGRIDVRIATAKEIRAWSSGAVGEARSFWLGSTSIEYRCTTEGCTQVVTLPAYKQAKKEVRARIDAGHIKTMRVPCPSGCGGTIRRQTESGFLPVAGSLFDASTFGLEGTEEYRTRFGRVELATPLIHPWAYQAGGRPLLKAWVAAGQTRPQLIAILKGQRLNGRHGVAAVRAVLGKEFKTSWVVRVVPVIPALYREGRDRTRVVARTIGSRYLWLVTLNQRALAKKAGDIPGTFAALQSSIERLFGWSRQHEGSITARLGGKQGLLRQSILGKRVDYSARAVIVPEPGMGLDQVGLPRAMFDAFASAIPDFAGDPIVLINRAPTLHRYSIRSGVAFPHDRGNVILIHPLTCGPMNADFDGDTVGIHVPLKARTRDEGRQLLPSRQTRSVANGGYLLHVAQDILTGLFLAAQNGDLPSKFLAGTKGAASDCLSATSEDSRGHAAAGVRLANLGFTSVSKAGLTLGIADIARPSRQEREQIVSALSRESGKAKEIWERLARGNHGVKLSDPSGASNPLGVMVASGGRGDPAQVGQLRAARGVVTGASGQPLHHVIPSSFRDGVPELEYFYAAHGTRKAMGDKKLITGPAGELTRWLVEGAYEFRVLSHDCARSRKQAPGMAYRIEARDRAIHDLSGRVLARPLKSAGFRVSPGTLLTAAYLVKLPKHATAWIRSPVTCRLDGGVCQLCYGTDLSTGQLVSVGAAVGIMAAQTIGEQGTQLSMRTFHGAGGGTDIDAARRLFRAAPGDRADSVTEFVSRVTEIYGWKPVSRRHVEVIFRCMHEGNTLVGIEQRARSSTRGLLARASFVRTADVLANAAFGEGPATAARLGAKDRLMMGLFTGGVKDGGRIRSSTT